jgi:hypothetical protein
METFQCHSISVGSTSFCKFFVDWSFCPLSHIKVLTIYQPIFIYCSTTFGTAFIGGVFGSLANLRSEINDRRTYYAWKRREVSKHMVKELQLNDDKLDQYEFVLASLLLLNKVEKGDIEQIMDKFRELAGDKGFIEVTDKDEDEGDVNVELEARGSTVGAFNLIPFKEDTTGNNAVATTGDDKC